MIINQEGMLAAQSAGYPVLVYINGEWYEYKEEEKHDEKN